MMNEYLDILRKHGYTDTLILTMYSDKKTPQELLDSLDEEYNYWLTQPKAYYEDGIILKNTTQINEVVGDIKSKIRINKINNILN